MSTVTFHFTAGGTFRLDGTNSPVEVAEFVRRYVADDGTPITFRDAVGTTHEVEMRDVARIEVER
jgi:hypothetical protein